MRASGWIVTAAAAALAVAAWLAPASAQEAPPADKPPPRDAVRPAERGGAGEKDPTLRDLESYRLRVGDQVEIVVFSGTAKLDPDIRVTLTVPANGEVSFPPAGKIHLLDRTVFDVQERVAQALKDTKFLASPIVGCVVTRYEPRVVYLIGAAQGQLDLPVHRNLRILEVLAKAGTLNAGRVDGGPSADFSRVTIRRMGADGRPFTIAVSVDDILFRGREEQNIVVFEGDLIYVPMSEQASPQASEWVYVLGKVRTPGRHPVLKGRTVFTLTKLIAMAGDFLEFADRTKIKVIRTTTTGREPFEIDFDDIIEGKRPDFELRADDLVYVPENWI